MKIISGEDIFCFKDSKTIKVGKTNNGNLFKL